MGCAKVLKSRLTHSAVILRIMPLLNGMEHFAGAGLSRNAGETIVKTGRI